MLFDEFLNIKSVEKMNGLEKTRFMNDLLLEYKDTENSHHMRLFYYDLLTALIKNHGH
tara:strand:+ start:269 stop:442 length:174 start_codon:yes stop_codon:yes gene_type:complete